MTFNGKTIKIQKKEVKLLKGILKMKIIRDKRKSKGISQKELAKRIGVDQTAVSMWETGKAMPKANKLPALAKILDCSIEELLEG